MITTAFIERCLIVRMHAARRLIDNVKRVPGKGPSGAVTEQRKNDYGCDNASQHLSTGLRNVGIKLVQILIGFHSGNGFPVVFLSRDPTHSRFEKTTLYEYLRHRGVPIGRQRPVEPAS
jgi:hypothetical protein